MNKTRYNRQYIANLAISTLVPLIKARGKLEAGNARQPAYRMLEAYGLEMLWIEKRPRSSMVPWGSPASRSGPRESESRSLWFGRRCRSLDSAEGPGSIPWSRSLCRRSPIVQSRTA